MEGLLGKGMLSGKTVPVVQEEKDLGIMAWAAQKKGQGKVGSCP